VAVIAAIAAAVVIATAALGYVIRKRAKK
jgi:hypothetical protein